MTTGTLGFWLLLLFTSCTVEWMGLVAGQAPAVSAHLGSSAEKRKQALVVLWKALQSSYLPDPSRCLSRAVRS